VLKYWNVQGPDTAILRRQTKLRYGDTKYENSKMAQTSAKSNWKTMLFIDIKIHDRLQ